ncbi:MAG: hypothetical protein PHS93_09920 [Candidatus Omnitrophica bacterium]|nr:hypothetical protein [Candidatus Omnitrophota bacterium]MDD5006596.1 hypothetical protein [Candidatus Omnitrophota bacterium]MDD5353466.1 hypothetical protein [Candidatus Omnitrophota bacterium]
MPCDKKECSLKVECFESYGKFNYPPCASNTEESAPSASSNIDYTAALREGLMQFLEDESPVLFEDVDFSKLATRLNAALQKQHCV